MLCEQIGVGQPEQQRVDEAVHRGMVASMTLESVKTQYLHSARGCTVGRIEEGACEEGAGGWSTMYHLTRQVGCTAPTRRSRLVNQTALFFQCAPG